MHREHFVPARLRLAKEHRGIRSYAELADLTGVTQRYLERLMTERDFRVSAADMNAIADALYVPRRWLMDESAPSVPVWAQGPSHGGTASESNPVESLEPTDYPSWMAAFETAWQAYLHQDGDEPGSSRSVSQMLRASALTWPMVHRSAVLDLDSGVLGIKHLHELAVMLGIPGTPDIQTLELWKLEYGAKIEASKRSSVSSIVGKEITDIQWRRLKLSVLSGSTISAATTRFWPFSKSNGDGSCYIRLINQLKKAKADAITRHPPRRKPGRPKQEQASSPASQGNVVDAYCSGMLDIFRHRFPDDHPMPWDDAVTEYRRIRKLARVSDEEQQEHGPERAVDDVEHNILTFIGRGRIASWENVKKFARSGGISEEELKTVLVNLDNQQDVVMRHQRGKIRWILRLGPGDQDYIRTLTTQSVQV